jgi:hypothetical protein
MSSPPAYDTPEHRIRSKLLNRLGIYDSSAAPSTQPLTAAQVRRHRILRGMGVGYTLHPTPPDGSAVRPPLDGVRPFREPLKKGEPLVSIVAHRGDKTERSKKNRIAFQDAVEVIPIPTRYEYSDRIKSRIWSNRHELQENAERNALEFAAEGWNWRNVTEDEGMYICSVSGELVHPIHLQHLMEEQQQASATPRGSLERGQPVHST